MKLSRRTAGFVVLGAVIAAFLVLLAVGLANKSPVTGKSGFTRVGKPAPGFVLPRVGGGEIDLADFSGEPMVINFWASWCPPCRQEALVLEDAWRAHVDDVQFVGVDIQDTDADAEAYLAEFNITYPNGLDRQGRVTVDYGVIGLPVTFFVNKAGLVERRWVGAISRDQLEAWVGELTAGQPPSGLVEGENLEGYFPLE